MYYWQRHDGLLHEITEGKPTRGRRIQMLHDLANDGELRTERYGDTEKGCQKPAVQQKTTGDEHSGNCRSSVQGCPKAFMCSINLLLLLLGLLPYLEVKRSKIKVIT